MVAAERARLGTGFALGVADSVVVQAHGYATLTDPMPSAPHDSKSVPPFGA